MFYYQVDMVSSGLEKKSIVSYSLDVIKPPQIRGARAMLGMTQAQLASAAGISTTGLNNIERGDADPKASTLEAIRQALEAGGVVFDLDAGGGPGVRFKTTWSPRPHDHPEPTGPATDILKRMEADIHEDRERPKHKSK